MKYTCKIADDDWNVLKVNDKEVIFEFDNKDDNWIAFTDIVFKNGYNLLFKSLADCGDEKDNDKC